MWAPSFAVGVNLQGYRFTGQLDELAIYDRALTVDEVTAHYSTGM